MQNLSHARNVCNYYDIISLEMLNELIIKIIIIIFNMRIFAYHHNYRYTEAIM